ncbi:MAG: peptidoglycan recognition family protein [Phycisphaerales bacterium]|nr:peptidoglycan recognition family protein [Phycisphaerales bacterium]
MNQSNTPQSDDRKSVSRREALRVAAKIGSTGVALGGLSALSGCNSSAQKRVKTLGGAIGDPIPSDPITRTNRPTPVYTPPPTTKVAIDLPLSALPSFVIPRSKWTSAQPKRWLADPMNRVSRITIHHDAIMPVPTGSYADSLRRMQLIRTGHLNNGWADVGYHFAVDPSGRIFQARPLELQGAHVKNNNPGNLGIVAFGNYEKIRPTQATLSSINKLVAYAMDRFSVSISNVHTHRELRSTACPGKYLQSQMVSTRARGGKLALAVGQHVEHS